MHGSSENRAVSRSPKHARWRRRGDGKHGRFHAEAGQGCLGEPGTGGYAAPLDHLVRPTDVGRAFRQLSSSAVIIGRHREQAPLVRDPLQGMRPTILEMKA